jgi:hypothetical protein
MSKEAYTVLMGPVDHDGARYKDGEEIPVRGDEAAALVAVGVIQSAKAAGKPPKPPEQETDKPPEADKPPAD